MGNQNKNITNTNIYANNIELFFDSDNDYDTYEKGYVINNLDGCKGIIRFDNQWSYYAKYPNSYSFLKYIEFRKGESNMIFKRAGMAGGLKTLNSNRLYEDKLCFSIEFNIYSYSKSIHSVTIEQIPIHNLPFLIKLKSQHDCCDYEKS